jgi:hypothetical protein
LNLPTATTRDKESSLMSERNKKQCIVLLPSSLYFDRMFDEVLELAILDTGLTPSRIHRSSLSPTPINVFVDEIEQAEALFADVSENISEIWIAVGCAVALGKPLCLISSRLDSSLQLGIQYLPLIPYPADALPNDYAQLQQNISSHLSAILPQPKFVQPEPQLPKSQSPDSQLPAPQFPESQFPESQLPQSRFPEPSLPSHPAPTVSDDLASYEVMALTIIDFKASGAGLSPRDLGLEMQARGSAHLTSHAMNALRRRRFIERKPVQLTQGNEVHISENLFLTRAGQEWLLRHGRRATTHRSTMRTQDLSLNKR